jgi:hypothetical protein
MYILFKLIFRLINQSGKLHCIAIKINILTPWSEVLLEKQAGSHSAGDKIPLLLMEAEGSLLCSQEPTTNPHPDPEGSIPQLHTVFL